MKAMRADDKAFAYNASPCQNGGHTLRSRANHCIQCNTARIGYVKRYFAEGYIYIAASPLGRLIKVGTTTDIERRKWQLNRWEYGRQGDWRIVAVVHTDNAGRVEGEAHSRLARYSVEGDYLRAGRRQRCLELFKCNFGDAKEALELALGGVALQIENEEQASIAFNFR